MVEPPYKMLQDRTDEILSKEASVDNIVEIKEEHVTPELTDVTNTPSSGELPDATRNLIVALPTDMELNLDIETPTPSAVLNPRVTPCCIKLTRCDISTTTPSIEGKLVLT